MKYLLFSFFFLASADAFFAQEEGIKFLHNGEWASALEKAKAENKLIFMDAYTTWCGPCKMMSKQTFPQKDVADLFNASFVNVKMDMEKGEGVDLAKKFGVLAYPTLLFIDPSDESIAHRTAGFLPPADFVALGKTALDPARRTASMDKKYAAGERDPEFLKKYTATRFGAYDGSHAAVAEEYLKTQKDLSTAENVQFIFDFSDRASSAGFQFMCKNKPLFIQKFGQNAVLGKIEAIVSQSVEGNSDITLEAAQQIFREAFPEKADEMASRYAMSFHRGKGDREAYAAAAIGHYKKFPSTNPEELNESAWTFYRVVENKKQLKAALGWAKKSVKLSPQYYNWDTVAALNFKLGSMKAARKAAQKAIDMAREAGEDFSSTQELLDQINAANQ